MKPPVCPICGLYFTTHPHFFGRRCLEPKHWLAAGLLHPTDYYQLGQLVIQAGLEHNCPSLLAKGQHIEARSC
ncbi:MAG: hypothetical protein FOGNACKC_03542 [Anaerolineae bacterium]|nr:hypothetical protein [Anaerolineae bacterium]